jgi:hypothetical protein
LIKRLFGWHSPDYKLPAVGQEVWVETTIHTLRRCVFAHQASSISVINPQMHFKEFTFAPAEYYNPDKPSHVGGIPTTCVKFWKAAK